MTDKNNLNDQSQMIGGIYEGIMSIFDEESNNAFHTELNSDLDATMFFTNLIKAGALIYMDMTNEEIDMLEFTHIANRLVVQDENERYERKLKNCRSDIND